MELKTEKKLGKLIVVCSQKGGVVKSQSTNEISFNLQKMGYSVLEIDADWTTGLTERTFPNELPL
ncbi:AAA family ATPase, partial [Salmonella enterica]|nr:AAA family ATPase [Salmonella enterica]